ncbi:subunit 5 of NADH dehydrogenase [ubiquinone] 1 alpha subcomplex [Chloropicon roscoffensis]|uniref:Subunit 5 of NADH dehydrogenase [ubiquinone] 1 alpha subcomplex n=1 Tax=Chloropicon roscoffensis TaxID=1461544 RepID=A0AAX4PF26_9CHLO
MASSMSSASALRFWASRFLRHQESHLGALSALGARGYKTTTGIVGVEVDPEAPDTLRHLLKKILREVKVIPENAQYRVSVETMANQRLEVVSKDISPEQMEEEIGQGQLEELILHARDELSLIPKMAEWKPWDVPEGHKIKMVVHDEPVPLPEEEGK